MSKLIKAGFATQSLISRISLTYIGFIHDCTNTLARGGAEMLRCSAQGMRDETPKVARHRTARRLDHHRDQLRHRKGQQKQILMLQGPVGPFFKHLQRRLVQSGVDVWRVSFNAGDRFFHGAKRIDFIGDLHEWADWLEQRLTVEPISCIILFGCMRPIHMVARRLAEKAGIPVLSLEEGYLRPGFISVEWRGNNAASPFAGNMPSTPAPSASSSLKKRDFRPFAVMCSYGGLYYALASLGARSERELLHRQYSPAKEAFYWARNYWRYLSRRSVDQRLIEQLVNTCSGAYFVVPLQVASDGQMAYGHGWTTLRLVEHVLRSFAKTAPRRQQLVFKVHPLERGHSNARYEVRQLAASLGIAHRVHVIETGALGPLVRQSAGVITINSTSGFSAIYHGVPLLVVGDAFYSHPKLAVCAGGKPDFDAFWHCRYVGQSEVRHNYLEGLRAACLKPGDFYRGTGISLACIGVVDRLAEIVDGSAILADNEWEAAW